MPSIITDSIDSGIYLGLNPIIDLNIKMDTQARISKLDLFNIVQNPISDKSYNDSLIDYSKHDSFSFLKLKKGDDSIESLIKNPKNKLSDLLQSDDDNIRMRANEYYDNVVQPKIDKEFAKNNGMFAPYQKGQEKYLDNHWWSESSKTKYGFNPTLSLKENDDIYHTNVWNNYSAGGKLLRGLGTGLGRIGEGILSGAGKTISYLGTGLYYGIQDIFEDESKGDTNFIASVADNAMARSLEDMDEDFKNQVLPVWKSINYDNKGFFSKLGDASFYQSEGADMAAFALGAMIPGIGFGKLGNVLKGLNTAGKLGKFGFLGAEASGYAGKVLQFATGAKNVGGVAGWAFNTANESFMEASGVHKSVKERLTEERRKGLNSMTDEAIEQAAADSAAKDFGYNFAILAASNAFENKLFGKFLKGREDVGDFISVNKATGTASKAVTNWKKFSSYLDPVNYLEKIPIIGKSFAPLSRVGFYSRLAFGLPGIKALAMEGLWEENAQLAAQRISEDKYYTSIVEGGGELTKETKSFFPQLWNQSWDAFDGNDVEAATSIGSGMLLGATMNVGIAKASGERKDILNKIDGYTDKKTKEKIKGSIERINDARDSMFSYTDVYETEKKGDNVTLKLGEDGKPIVNPEKAKAVLDKLATVNKHIDIADQTSVKELKDLHFKEAFSLYMHEIFKVDGQKAVIESIDDISKKGKDDFNLFNVQFGDLKNDPAKYIDFAKQLETIYDKSNKLEFVNSNNHNDKDKFEYEKAQARSLFYSLSSSKLINEDLLNGFMDNHKTEFKNEANQLVYDKDDKSIAFSLFSLLTDLNLNSLKIAHLETNEEDYTKHGKDVKSKIKELKTKNKEIVDRYSSIYDIKEQENGYYTESSDNELVSEHLNYAAHMSNNISFLNDDILSFSNQKTGLTHLSKYIKSKVETIASNIEEAKKAEDAIIEEAVSSKQKEDKDKEDIALGFLHKIGEKEYTTISSLEDALKNNEISFKEYEEGLEVYSKLLPAKEAEVLKTEETDLDKLLNKHVIGSLTIPNYLNNLLLNNPAEFAIIKDNQELFLELREKNKRLETNQVKSFNAINNLLFRAEDDKAIIVEENGKSYYNIAGKLYQRVSNFIGNIFNKNTVSSLENGENAVTVGNYVDLVSRILLENTDYTFEDIGGIIDNEKQNQINTVTSPIELLKAKKNYRHFDLHNVELFEQVKGQIIDIKKAILEKHPGAIIVSKEVLIKRDGNKEGELGVAGTTDVLVIDKAGIVHIYDFKTKKASISDNVLTKLNTKYNDKSDLDKYTNQQSAYKQLLENEGVKTGDINLIVFPITYAPIIFKGDIKNELDLLNYAPIPALVKLTQDFVLVPLTYKEDVRLLPNKNEELIEDILPATEIPISTNDNNDIEAKKADIEKLEKEKQEALQPLIEEKEQIEKEIEEIEKNDNGSVKQEVETIDDFLKNNNITEQQLKDEENKLKNHLDELGLKLDTEYNFEDIINRIIKNVKGRFLKTVLKGINSLVGNKLKTKFVFSSVRHEDAAGQYFSHDDTIKIYIPNLSLRVFTLNKRGKEYQQETNIVEVFNKVFIHELIHAFTILKIRATETNAKLGLATIMNPSIEKERLNISRSDQKTIDSLNKIFDFLKNNELLKGEYGVSDIVELVTEALSNEGFAEKLKSIELPKELRYKTGNNNVFENIILYISKLVEDLLNLGSAYSDDNALDSIAAIINDFGNSYSESDQQSFMKINKAEERAREYFKYGKSNQSDNLGSETTKLQQLKQKLAEVNKKIDEVTKRFDAQIAQKQSELKALEEQSTSAKKADIEIGKVGNTEYEVKVDGVYYQGKKLNNPENKTHRQLIEADIERRRQEELNNPKEGLTKKDALIEAQKDLGNLDTKEKRDRNKDRIEALKQFINLLSNSNSIEEAHDKFKDSFTETTPVTNRIAELFNAIFGAKNNINAKYDAELAALENTKPVSDKKADIEKRRQEELTKLIQEDKSRENPPVNDNSSSNDGESKQEESFTRMDDEESNTQKEEENEEQNEGVVIIVGDKNDLEKQQILNGRKAFKTENKTVTRETQQDDKRRDLMTEDGNAILLKDDPYEYEANRFLREMIDNSPEKYTLFIVKDTEEWVNQRIPEEGRQKALDNLGYVIIVKNKKGEVLRFNGKTFTVNKKGAPLLYSIDKNVFKDKDGGREERASLYVDYMNRISKGTSIITIKQVVEMYKREEEEKKTVFSMLENGTLEFPIDIISISKGILPKGVSKPIHERFGDNFELQVIINPENEEGLKKGSVLFKPKQSEEWLPLHTRKLSHDESVELRDLLKYEYNLSSEKDKIDDVKNYINSLVYLSKTKYFIFEKLLPNGNTIISIKERNLDPNKEDVEINALDLSDEVLMNVVNKTNNSVVDTNQLHSTFSIKDGKLIEKKIPFKDFLKGKIFTNTLPLQYKGEKVFHRIQSYISFNIDETLLESEAVENKEEKIAIEKDEKKPVIIKKKDRKKTSSLKNNTVNKVSEIKEDKDCTK